MSRSILLQRVQELCESRGGRPWAPRPNEPYGFCGRKATLNHTHALVTVCPQYVNPTSEDIKLYIIFITNSKSLQKTVDVLDSSRAEVLKCSPPPKPVSYTHLTLPTKVNV